MGWPLRVTMVAVALSVAVELAATARVVASPSGRSVGLLCIAVVLGTVPAMAGYLVARSQSRAILGLLLVLPGLLATLIVVAALLPADLGNEASGLMAEGRTNLGIARRLSVSDRTVEAHVANILLKLGLDSTDEDHRRVLAVLKFLGHKP